MVLRELFLTNFRNFSKKSFSWSSGVNLVYGENGSGKSNLLEAIYFLAVGDSWHTERLEDLMREGDTRTRVEGVVGHEDMSETSSLEVTLEKENALTTAEPLLKRRFRINGVPRLKRDFVGNLRAVIFSPEQLNLLNSPPSYRRKYMDLTLSQLNKNYYLAISTYKKALINRNHLLYQFNERTSKNKEIAYWNEQIVNFSLVVSEERKKFFDSLNASLIKDTLGLWEGGSFLRLDYQPHPLSLKILEQNWERDVAAGWTLLGPHREDVVFFRVNRKNNKETNLQRFGSRGEQRLALLALKVAEGEFLAQKGHTPIFLLDDIFSELDERRRRLIFHVAWTEQLFLTTAEAAVARQLTAQGWPIVDLSG